MTAKTGLTVIEAGGVKYILQGSKVLHREYLYPQCPYCLEAVEDVEKHVSCELKARFDKERIGMQNSWTPEKQQRRKRAKQIMNQLGLTPDQMDSLSI